MLLMFKPMHAISWTATLAMGSLILPSCNLAAQEESWRDFRGPGANGYVASAGVPLVWSEEENVTWKLPISGSGWSSPVVDGGKAWLTTSTADGKKLQIVAVDVVTGALLHQQVVFENDEPEKKNPLNSFASPSAVVEPGHVYVHFGSYGTACFDTDSFQQVWQRRDINCDHLEGPGSSPILFDDFLIFNVDGGDVQYVIALDKQTGTTKWKSNRSIDLSGVPPDLRKAYSTPIVTDAAGKLELISSSAQGSYSYDPQTGAERWRIRYKGFSVAARPLAAKGMVYLITGFPRSQMLSVKLPADGDVTDSNVAWKYSRNVPKMSSPLLAGDRIYMVDDGGFGTCLDRMTGTAIWRKRIGSEHCASPICVGDRIYYFDREGQTVVIKRSDVFEEIARNQLDEGFMATPAVVGDAFLMRTRTHLYRVESAAK